MWTSPIGSKITAVPIFAMRTLLGWAAVTGGGLSAMALALLTLGPALGFYPWNAAQPGPRSAGAVDLPAVLRVAAPRAGGIRAFGGPRPLGAPAAGAIVASVGQPFPASSGRRRTGGGGGDGGRREPVGGSGPATGTPVAATPAPAPAAQALEVSRETGSVSPPATASASDRAAEANAGRGPGGRGSEKGEAPVPQPGPLQGKAVGRRGTTGAVVPKAQERPGGGRGEEAPAAPVTSAGPMPAAEKDDGRPGGGQARVGDNHDQHHGRGHDHDENGSGKP